MSETPNLSLPFLAAGQAQKHVTLNEIAEILDAATHLSVLSRTLGTPPGSPALGARYLLPSGATGAWNGHDGKIASWNGFGWRFLEPQIGWLIWDQETNVHLVLDGASWVEVGNTSMIQNAVAIGVNATADNSNRLAVKSDNVLFSHEEGVGHGDLRAIMNKMGAANTASQLYQTGFSGRAETGLMGNDQFAIKVSTDGANWKQALTIDPVTGVVSVPFGIAGAGGGALSVHAPVNMGLATTLAAGALTIRLTTSAGLEPSGGSQCVLPFRSAIASSGEVTMRQVFAQTSITLSSGSTLGVLAANAPFALWVVAFDDAGTARLGVINCLSGRNVFPLGRASPLATSTAEGGAGGADNAHTFYSAAAMVAKPYCILGRLEWSSGLAAIGAWAAPDRIEVWHPSMKLPGDVVQVAHTVKTDTFTSTISGALTDIPGLSLSVAPTSAANLIRATPRVQGQTSTTGDACSFALLRGSTNIGGGVASGNRVSVFAGLQRTTDNNSTSTATALVVDAPGTVSPTLYKVQFILQSSGTLFVNRTHSDSDVAGVGRYSSSITLEEIQS
ncbi:MAG: DUF2793 domain-containing protein [Rhizobiales bacterium]|nr:DUF2793 domain-containing protein [Hyphomicrobiales bacterium]